MILSKGHKNSIAISVIMSIYCEPEAWLRESVDSILNQTFTDFEFIIINDNPDRETNVKILEHYVEKDNRVIAIKNNKNIGLTNSLNIGLRTAKGKYIARMDGDDISLPNRLNELYLFMEQNPKIGVCGSYLQIFGDISRKDIYLYKKNNLIKSSLILKNPIPHPSAFIRKEILDKSNIKYDASFKAAQDYKLWLDLSSVTQMAIIGNILVKYRVQKKQVSQNPELGQKEYAKHIRNEAIKKYLRKDYVEFIGIKDRKAQFEYVCKKLPKSHSKSFLLLVLYLSFVNYKFYDHIQLIKNVPAFILKNEFRIIVNKIIKRNCTNSLI